MATATKTKASSTTLRIARTDLLAAVSAASRAVGRGPKPVLQNLRIGDGLVTGTDLEVRIDVAIGEMCEPFLVPADRLASILKAAGGDEVTLSAKGSTVTVKCGGGRWELPTESVDEFPAWEPAGLKPVCRLPADQFARAARATVYATDTESSRYTLGGVLISVTGGNPTWVATDGRRLAAVETETDQDLDDSATIVPARVISIATALATGLGSVQVEANAKEVVFGMDTVTVTGLLVAGKFPPEWRTLILKDDAGEPSVLNVKELESAVRAAAIVTSEASKGVALRWESDTLVLSGRSSEYGESTVKCPLMAAGTTIGTKLDPHCLVQYLAALPPDEEPQVKVYATSSDARVLLKCGPYTGVIMPLAAD